MKHGLGVKVEAARVKMGISDRNRDFDQWSCRKGSEEAMIQDGMTSWVYSRS